MINCLRLRGRYCTLTSSDGASWESDPRRTAVIIDSTLEFLAFAVKCNLGTTVWSPREIVRIDVILQVP